MMDSSEVGCFGTLRLLKRHDPNTTIAFFPIDDEEVTFGRSKDCSIRLYYDCISELHCTLRISEERKAFLTIQGTNGVTVDGCEVIPKKAEGLVSTTVPLTNGSDIEIFRKRFRFEYPPKEIRAALLATPRNPGRRRSLRMSMIQSAQVFTPRVNLASSARTPRRGSISDNVNWEAIRSPVKIPSNNNGPTETMLLDGDGENALVVEEEKDLIILEHVDDPPKPSEPYTTPTPVRNVRFSSSQANNSLQRIGPHQPVTPTNRRRSGSLRKAVVLRSAQRVQIERDRENQRGQVEDEEEEEEVELAVSPERELGPFELQAHEDDSENHDERIEDDPEVSLNPGVRNPLGVIKAGFNMFKRITIDKLSPEIIPLPDDGDSDEDEEDEEAKEDEGDEGANEYDADDDTVQSQTPIRRNLGPFMTPQVAFKPAQRVPVDVKPRASVGGESFAHHLFGGARRVLIREAWKLNDIASLESQKSQRDGANDKPKITEEERRAILQRRKSALETASDLPMPGPRSKVIDQSEAYTPGEDEHEDAETMLEKMKEKMHSLRRKSEARRTRLSLSTPHKPQGFSLLATASVRHENVAFASKNIDDGYSQETAADDHDDPDRSLETPTKSNGVPVSHTPRFDAIRERFKQPSAEPKTPSFTGIRKLFDEGSRPSHPPKTPSFVGMKQLFKQRPNSVMATPHMYLDEIFEQDDHEDGEADDPLQLGAHDGTISSATTSSSGDVAVVEETLTEGLDDSANPTRKGRRATKKATEDVNDTTEKRTTRGTLGDAPKRRTGTRAAKAHKETAATEEQEEGTPVKTRNHRTKKPKVEEEAVQIVEDTSEQVEQDEEPVSKSRRGRRAKTPTPPLAADPHATKATRPKAEQIDDTEVLSAEVAAPKVSRARRGAKSKSANNGEALSSEVDEETSTAPKKTRGRKVAAKKMAPVAESEEEDKENTDDQIATAVGKTAGKTTRARKAMATVETTDVPTTRRTRSRK